MRIEGTTGCAMLHKVLASYMRTVHPLSHKGWSLFMCPAACGTCFWPSGIRAPFGAMEALNPDSEGILARSGPDQEETPLVF